MRQYLQLTERQRDVVEAIRTFTAETGKAPTLDEIGRAVGMRSTLSVRRHLDNLTRLEILHPRRFGRQRDIHLVEGKGCALAA